MTISKTEKENLKKTETSKKVAPKKASTVKKGLTKKTITKKVVSKKTNPSPEALYKMTEVAAYFIALKNDFAGNPSDYWVKAEAEIKALYQ